MSPGPLRPRLRVLVPRGPLPCWLGEALCLLDALGKVRLQLRPTDAAPLATLSWLDRCWSRSLPALQDWAPTPDQQARLQHWTSAAFATADLSLSLGADVDAPGSTPSNRAPLHWALCEGDGSALWQRFPLLRPIAAGRGIRLNCLQFVPATSSWRLRRTLHLPSSSRYSSALPRLASAIARTIELALSDLRALTGVGMGVGMCAGTGKGTGAGAGATSLCDPWSALSLPRRAQADVDRTWSVIGVGLRGRWRDWIGRQRERWTSEYWRIGVIDAPVGALVESGPLPAIRWLTVDDRAGYWADPFGLSGDPRRLACEFFDERTGIGRLELLGFDAADKVVDRRALPVGAGRHVSFPSVFEFDGRCFGLAETVATRECRLHEVGDDGSWRPLFAILQGVAAADPALFRWDGRYWLAYTDADLGERDNLCLRYAERLEGPWQPHAGNPVKVDVTSARMAGRPFWHEGALYRPAQDCLRTYGAAVVIHRIVELSPTRFREVEVRRLDPKTPGACPDGMHTLNAWGDRTLVDGKRYGFNLTAICRKLRRASFLRRFAGAPSVHTRTTLATTPPTAPRVLVYVPHLRMGGGETSMLRLAQGLAAAGLEVDVVVHTLRTVELALPAGLNLISLDCSGTAAAVRRLAAQIRARRPQWVLSAFPHTNVAAILARALSGTDARCVVTEHAPISHQIAQQGGWKYRLLPPLIGWAYRRADAVVAVSDGVCADLTALVALRAAPSVIRNPVLPADFATEISTPPDHPWLRDPALDIVLSVSRLSPEKDLPTLVRAFAEVHRTRPRARLLMAGEGPERAHLEALVDDLGLGDVVRLPGRTDQPLRWMHHARVFVLPSRFEGFGNVLIEALACGTPVVSTDCPVGPREVLEHGAFGALVPVGDAMAMAREIHRAIDLRSTPPGAREAALAHTQARACDAYLHLFESLCPAPALPC